MNNLKQFIQNLLQNSKVIIIILLIIILFQACGSCNHKSKQQWKEKEWTEQVMMKDSIIKDLNNTIEFQNIRIIQLEDSLKLMGTKCDQLGSMQKSLQDDKALMREIIRKQNRKE